MRREREREDFTRRDRPTRPAESPEYLAKNRSTCASEKIQKAKERNIQKDERRVRRN